MQVKAIQDGYYGHIIRKVGEVFELTPFTYKDRQGEKVKVSAEEQFSHFWMERVDGGPVPKNKKVLPLDLVPVPPPPSALGPSKKTDIQRAQVLDPVQPTSTGDQDVI